MSEKDMQITDALGIKEFGEAIKIVTQGTVDAAGAFLSKICLPAAEELGLFFRDKVSNLRPLSEWRLNNLIKSLEYTERLLRQSSGENYDQLKAPPRLVSIIANQASWIDDEDVQKLWAGLLSSTCTADGKDESNLIFTTLLAQLTTLEAKLLNYGCDKCSKRMTSSGVVIANGSLFLTRKELYEIAFCDDFQRLDREMDHLRSLGLIEEGAFADPIERDDLVLVANVAPTMLGLQMYVRCQGSGLPPTEFFQMEQMGQST